MILLPVCTNSIDSCFTQLSISFHALSEKRKCLLRIPLDQAFQTDLDALTQETQLRSQLAKSASKSYVSVCELHVSQLYITHVNVAERFARSMKRLLSNKMSNSKNLRAPNVEVCIDQVEQSRA